LQSGARLPGPRMNGEEALIERIRGALTFDAGAARRAGLKLGIGDDAALLRTPPGSSWAISCDAFLEGVHFLPHLHPPDSVGYKALARAASDLAAMGVQPRFFLLSLALPPARAGHWLDRLLAGMKRAARRMDMAVIGGDTAQFPSVTLNLTVIGQQAAGGAITRAGARPGDRIYVSGRLGGAQLGLEILLSGKKSGSRWKSLLRSHLYPTPRISLGLWLARHGLASAMIDTSDGLSTDLGHIARASGTGARLWRERIPAVRVPAELRQRDLDPLMLALHGGEDYELLFTVRRLASRLPAMHGGVPLTEIGVITREKGLWLVDAAGRSTRLVQRGWDHFRRR
jgi:thiamine-monophosphate kinase